MRARLIRGLDTGAELRCTTADALALFDALAPVDEPELRGRWCGRELYTDHPLDGVLSKISWYGKHFDDSERVHPVLVRNALGQVYPLEPRLIRMPMLTAAPPTPEVLRRIAPAAMTLLRPLVHARGHGARLETIRYRGVSTAAMHYRDKPVTDVFRTVDDDTVLGLMDYRGMPRPYFFVLRRD